MRTSAILGIIVFILLATLSEMAMAQTPEDIRRIEEEKREALEQTELRILEGEDRVVLDYGGWFNARYDDYDDDDNDYSQMDSLAHALSFDYRLWMKISYRPPAGASYVNEHSVYLRLKDIRTERTHASTNQGHDHDGPDLDYGYLVLDLRPCYIEAGRRYFSVGQGIAYSNVSDGVEFYASLENWNLKALASHTLPDEENIDTSVPGYERKSRRIFYGVEVTYLGITNHGIYGYLLAQRDYSDEDPDDPLRDYTYNSDYIGLGSQGKIFPNMHYWAEIIRETGQSRVYATSDKMDVTAWGGDFGISYDLDVYSHPNFSVEYAFGTGDEDRVSVTDTLSGNTFGDDKNFLYFGYLPAGYALSPRLSNLYFYKAGVLLKPLEKWRLFRNFSAGLDYYRYYKYKKGGGIYDADASVSDHDVGWEIDMNVSWQILSDFTVSLQYGHFEPGEAYPPSADDSEDYLSVGTSYTF